MQVSGEASDPSEEWRSRLQKQLADTNRMQDAIKDQVEKLPLLLREQMASQLEQFAMTKKDRQRRAGFGVF